MTILLLKFLHFLPFDFCFPKTGNIEEITSMLSPWLHLFPVALQLCAHGYLHRSYFWYEIPHLNS